MLHRQQGISLTGVAIGSALLAAVAMAAIFSMRYDRNLFAEGWAKVVGGKQVQATIEAARGVSGSGTAAAGPMRKCVINGATVVSNTDCADSNRTSKTIKMYDTRGIEAPKAPPPAEAAAPTSDLLTDKIIEKQLR